MSVCDFSQVGDSQLPADIENAIKEYLCVQAYLVSIRTAVLFNSRSALVALDNQGVRLW